MKTHTGTLSGTSPSCLEQIADILRKHGPMRFAAIEAHCRFRQIRFSRMTLHRWLKELISSGVVCRVTFGSYGLAGRDDEKPDVKRWAIDTAYDLRYRAFRVRGDLTKLWRQRWGFDCPVDLLEIEVRQLERARVVIEVQTNLFQWDPKVPLPEPSIFD